MKLENQVCTLKQAKRLKELGIEQIGVFAWCQDGADEADMFVAETNTDGEGGHFADDDEYSAFTVAELGVMLPYKISFKKTQAGVLKSHRLLGVYSYGYIRSSSGEYCTDIIEHENEAITRAAMLIYLLENNLTTPEEVNQRLQAA